MLQAIEEDVAMAFHWVEEGTPPHHDLGVSLRSTVAGYRNGGRALWASVDDTGLSAAVEAATLMIETMAPDHFLITWGQTTEGYELDSGAPWPFPACAGDRYEAVFAAWFDRGSEWDYTYRPFALDEDKKGVWSDPLPSPFPSRWVHGLLAVTAERFAIEYGRAGRFEDVARRLLPEDADPSKVALAMETAFGLAIKFSGGKVHFGPGSPFPRRGDET